MKVQILLTAMTTVAAAFPQDDCNLGRFKGVIPDEQVNGTVDCLVRKVNALQEQTREQRKRLDAQEEAQKLEIYEVRQISRPSQMIRAEPLIKSSLRSTGLAA